MLEQLGSEPPDPAGCKASLVRFHRPAVLARFAFGRLSFPFAAIIFGFASRSLFGFGYKPKLHDPVPVRFFDAHREVFGAYLIADLGFSAQYSEDVAAKRIELLVLYIQTELFV